MAALRIDQQCIDRFPIARDLEGSQMRDRRCTSRCFRKAIEFAHVKFVELKVWIATRLDQVLEGPMREVIDPHDAVAPRQEYIRQV